MKDPHDPYTRDMFSEPFPDDDPPLEPHQQVICHYVMKADGGVYGTNFGYHAKFGRMPKCRTQAEADAYDRGYCDPIKNEDNGPYNAGFFDREEENANDQRLDQAWEDTHPEEGSEFDDH